VSVAGRSQQGPPSPKARLTMAGSPKPKVASARRHLLQQRQPPPQRQPPDGPEGEGLGRSSAAAPDVRAEMQALASGFVPPTQVRRVIESPCLGNCTHGDSITMGFVPPTQGMGAPGTTDATHRTGPPSPPPGRESGAQQPAAHVRRCAVCASYCGDRRLRTRRPRGR
jgi:hypothetical protein